MEINKFMELIRNGFDVSFNYKEVFYTISLLEDGKYGIGGDNGFIADFNSIDSIPNYVIDDKSINDIVNELSEEEVFF